jgi:dGTPase
MRAHGEFFDHNLHALRIVEHFEQRYAAFRGLNLSFEVREGIIKHSRDYSAAEFPQLSEYLLDQRPPLEAQLVDLADEIAYTSADLDDGLESEFIRLGQIRENVPLFERFYVAAEEQYPAAPEKLKVNEALKSMLDAMVGDLLETTQTQVDAHRVRSVEDVRRCPQRLATFSASMDAARRQAKQFLYQNLYYCPELRRDKERGERVIQEMFEHWMTDPRTLPRSYREQVEQGTPLARVVCDYIAGMTDNFIDQQHLRTFGSEVG